MIWHVLALFTACLWGSTFAASSVLISAGITPAEIMCLRFILAYILLLPFCHRNIITSWRDELLFVLLGITGGSLYFLSENYAVKLTSYTSTVALIVCTCPILTALINRIMWRAEHLSNRFIIGSLLALAGVTLVVLNGVFVLDDNPWVILLSFCAALLWSIYSLILKVQERRYGSDVITRKVFLWGIITMLPVCFMEISNGDSNLFPLGSNGSVSINIPLLVSTNVSVALLFLAIIASLGCFLIWNIVCRRLSVVTASNYLYFNPVTSLFVGAIVLDESVTLLAVIGCAVTILGVWLCNSKRA
ncbi:MAG: DMT family transporter [Bacteroidales bacterium]|nr:DMT family transporter [Candidatus Liminaster caballi]